MIICINGNPGAGKSTLGESLVKLNKNKGIYKIKVVETDDIDDGICLDLIKHAGKQATDKDLPALRKKRKTMYKATIVDLIKKYTNNDVVLVFVGILHHDEDLFANIKLKYYIDIDPETNFKQLLTRTANDICKNKDAIISALTNNTDKPGIANKLLLHKYKIRSDFPIGYDDFIKRYKKKRTEHKKKGYKLATKEEIYSNIQKIIKK